MRGISRVAGDGLAEQLRYQGQPVTIFRGEGRYGPVTQLMIVCALKRVSDILLRVRCRDPNAFCAVDIARMPAIYRLRSVRPRPVGVQLPRRNKRSADTDLFVLRLGKNE